MCVAGPDQISNEYADVNDAALAATTSLSILHVTTPAGGPAVADISRLHADFLSAGSKQHWMVGLSTHYPRAMMFRTDESSPTYYTITVTGWVDGDGFGASWTYKDSSDQERIFFAAPGESQLNAGRQRNSALQLNAPPQPPHPIANRCLPKKPPPPGGICIYF